MSSLAAYVMPTTMIAKTPSKGAKLRVTDKKRKKDSISNDPIIKEAEKRIAAINVEHAKLNEKISKRARLLVQKTAIDVISQQKWLIHGVDMYRKDLKHFQLSLSVAYQSSDNNQVVWPNQPQQSLSSTYYANKAVVKLDNQSHFQETFSMISSQMDRYNIGQFVFDEAYLTINYDSLTISAQGEDCQELVFALIKKLKLKIDYVSYIKTTELAEAEIAARKQLIDDLSSTVLFEV